MKYMKTRLSKYRRRQGITQGDLAVVLSDHVGGPVDASMVSRWERKERFPSLAWRHIIEVVTRGAVASDDWYDDDE